jgi:hypothetical protein
MISALLMFRRVLHAFRYAVREEDFLGVFGAGALLVLIGTIVYSLGLPAVGIGILVEILRRLGLAFVTVQAEEKRRSVRDEPEAAR